MLRLLFLFFTQNLQYRPISICPIKGPVLFQWLRNAACRLVGVSITTLKLRPHRKTAHHRPSPISYYLEQLDRLLGAHGTNFLASFLAMDLLEQRK